MTYISWLREIIPPLATIFLSNGYLLDQLENHTLNAQVFVKGTSMIGNKLCEIFFFGDHVSDFSFPNKNNLISSLSPRLLFVSSSLFNFIRDSKNNISHTHKHTHYTYKSW